MDDLSSQIPADERKGFTLLRTIIDLTCLLSAAGTGGIVSMGIALVSLEAAAAAVFPNPEDDDDYGQGWIWRTKRVIAATNVNDISMNSRFLYDLKSRRKFSSEDMTLYLMIVNDPAASASVNTDGLIRTLWAKS